MHALLFIYYTPRLSLSTYMYGHCVEEATALIVVCLGSVPHMVDKGCMCANYAQRKWQLYWSVREHAHKSQPFQKLNCGVEFQHTEPALFMYMYMYVACGSLTL